MSFGRDGRHGRGRAGRLVVLLALAAMLAAASGPPARSAPPGGFARTGQSVARLTCQVRVHRGKRVCWCWNGRWVTAPMVLCRLAG